MKSNLKKKINEVYYYITSVHTVQIPRINTAVRVKRLLILCK